MLLCTDGGHGFQQPGCQQCLEEGSSLLTDLGACLGVPKSSHSNPRQQLVLLGQGAFHPLLSRGRWEVSPAGKEKLGEIPRATGVTAVGRVSIS